MASAKTVRQYKRPYAATKGRMRNRTRRRSSEARNAKYQQKAAVMKVLAFYLLDLGDLGRENRALIRSQKNDLRNYWKIVEAWTAMNRRRGKADNVIKNMLDFVWTQIKAGKNVQACLADLKKLSK